MALRRCPPAPGLQVCPQGRPRGQHESPRARMRQECQSCLGRFPVSIMFRVTMHQRLRTVDGVHLEQTKFVLFYQSSAKRGRLAYQVFDLARHLHANDLLREITSCDSLIQGILAPCETDAAVSQAYSSGVSNRSHLKL